jgi:hypothetical protein
MSFANKPYLQPLRNEPIHVQYLNVAESALLFKSNTNLSSSHDFNTLKNFDTPSEYNRSISTATENDGLNIENSYFQLSKSSRSEFNNSSNSSKFNNTETLTTTTTLVNLTNKEHDYNGSVFNSSTKSTSQSSSKGSARRKMPSKINLLSNHQARMRKLEKLMNKNIILTPIAIIFSIIIAIILFISIFTDYYEYSYYDINALNRKILNENNSTLNDIEQKFLNISNKTSSSFSSFIIHHNKSSSEIEASDIVNLFFKLPNSDNETHHVDNKTYIFYKLLSSNLTGDLGNNEFYILTRIKISFFDNVVIIKNYYIYTTYSGLWQTCNFLSGKLYFYL